MQFPTLLHIETEPCFTFPTIVVVFSCFFRALFIPVITSPIELVVAARRARATGVEVDIWGEPQERSCSEMEFVRVEKPG